MNILSFSTHILWPPHYDTELEIIQNHLNDGDEVTQAVCNGQLSICDLNLKHDAYICALCMSRRRKGRSLVKGTIRNIPLIRLTSDIKDEIGSLRKDFKDIEDLTSYRIDTYDIGFAVASSLISLLRDPSLDTKVNKALIDRYLSSSLQVYRSVQKCLDKVKFHKVYVFNGRFSHVRAIFRACQSRNVECIIHERGHNIHYYELFNNILPHDLSNMDKRIRNCWVKTADDIHREEIGAQFYLDRAKGKEQSWYSFTVNQQKDLLPDNWNAQKKNIVIFNSSEDEFVALGSEWANPLYPDQFSGARKIIGSLEKKGLSNLNVYIRMHPNNKEMAQGDLNMWYQLKSEILSVIHPESAVDTYSLIRNADTVLTFGSTVGIEAVFWGKPSVLAGLSPYRNLGGTYNPASHDHLISLLIDDLQPKDKLPAIMFGFYMNTYGLPYKYYRAEGIGSGRFKGVDLNSIKSSRLTLLALLIRKVLAFILRQIRTG